MALKHVTGVELLDFRGHRRSKIRVGMQRALPVLLQDTGVLWDKRILLDVQGNV